MRLVIALGGNALLRRGEPLTQSNQRRNIKLATEALAPLAQEHQLIITHGNGPQVGQLALQSAVGDPDDATTLDILDAETEGMIGYLITQELSNGLAGQKACAAILTQIEVAKDDPAFILPTKPIGPVYTQAEAEHCARAKGWSIAPDGSHYRRVVPSPKPHRILELDVIKQLVAANVVVICAGGGGIPVVKRPDGQYRGVEAVIDKDAASALLARELNADALLLLTDIKAVQDGWGTPAARAIRCISPAMLRKKTFAAGSMAPKIDAACAFVESTGRWAGIGRLQDADAILAHRAGTRIMPNCSLVFW